MNRLRKATLDDLHQVVVMIEGAKQLLKEEGITQWQSGAPNEKTIKQDIQNETCFVLEVDGVVAATVNLSQTPDPNYEEIDGFWQNPEAPYVTIHRLAVHPLYRTEGLGRIVIEKSIQWAYENNIMQVRIDTHFKNYRMIYLLQKFRFEYAGVIEVDDPIDPKRNAYQYFIETF